MWSVPERLECEVLQKVRYINTLPLPFFLYYEVVKNVRWFIVFSTQCSSVTDRETDRIDVVYTALCCIISARRPSDASLSTVASDSSDVNNNDKSVEQIFDPTGMYYWCPPCSLDEVLLVKHCTSLACRWSLMFQHYFTQQSPGNDHLSLFHLRWRIWRHIFTDSLLNVIVRVQQTGHKWSGELYSPWGDATCRSSS